MTSHPIGQTEFSPFAHRKLPFRAFLPQPPRALQGTLTAHLKANAGENLPHDGNRHWKNHFCLSSKIKFPLLLTPYFNRVGLIRLGDKVNTRGESIFRGSGFLWDPRLFSKMFIQIRFSSASNSGASCGRGNFFSRSYFPLYPSKLGG